MKKLLFATILLCIYGCNKSSPVAGYPLNGTPITGALYDYGKSMKCTEISYESADSLQTQDPCYVVRFLETGITTPGGFPAIIAITMPMADSMPGIYTKNISIAFGAAIDTVWLTAKYAESGSFVSCDSFIRVNGFPLLQGSWAK